MSPTQTALLRHTLATLAYRSRKVLAGTPAGFADFNPGGSARTPGQVLAHMGDLFDWALQMVDGKQVWKDSTPLPWDDEAKRFYAALRTLDDRFASGAELAVPESAVFQGPIADALTHLGQLSMLRRLAGAPVKGENYFKAEVVAGRIDPAEQTLPRREF